MTGLRRNVFDKLIKLLEIFPVVLIVGPRQCGKSFLCQHSFPTWHYFDLEKSSDFDFITGDYSLFFSQYQKNVIIDEAQEAPDLFKNLRGVVDANRKDKGRFILTGSSSLMLLKTASDSLAGRVGIIELGTFKFNEFEQRALPDFYNIFQHDLSVNTLKDLQNIKSQSSGDMIEYFLKGSYPDAFFVKDDQLAYQLWYQNYHDTYVRRDLKKLFPKLDSLRFRRFLGMLSDLSGTIINKAQLGRSLDVSETTIRDYLEIAHHTFLWRMIPSFEKTISKSLVKMPKGIFRDSGLNWFLAGVDTREKLLRSPRVGQNFESWVIEEIIKALESTTLTGWHYSYYRTKNGAEVDLIIDGHFGVLPIEIKWSSDTSIGQISSLINLVEKNNYPLGVVINNSSSIRLIHNKIIQIPVSYI